MSHSVQQEAITHTSSPLCVIAGPGTGKTNLLTQKVIALISQGYEPQNILVLTFTQKAAEEISSRVQNELGEEFLAKTYHSFFLELIQEWDGMSKYPQGDFSLIDEVDQQYFFLDFIKKNSLTSTYSKISNKEIAVGFQKAIGLLKEHGITPDKFPFEKFESKDYASDLVKIYAAYEKYKFENSFLDFGDLQLEVKNILNEMGDEIKKQYSYILVDEFQDTNTLQLEIVNALSDSQVTVVGDPKQSIYGFRGTSQDSLELFCQKKNAKVLYLKENFRSSQTLVNSFNNFIADFRNKQELLQATQSNQGEIEHIHSSNELAQNHFIVEKINTLLKNKSEEKLSIGILCRTKSQVREFSQLLNTYEINHEANQIEHLFQHPLIKEILHLLQIIEKPKEQNIAFFEVLSSLHLREETLLRLSRNTSHYEKSYYELLKNKPVICEDKEDNNILKNFYQQIEKALLLKQTKYPVAELVLRVIEIFNYYKKAYLQGEFAIKQLNTFVEFISKTSKTHQFSTLKELNIFLSLAKQLDISSQASDEEIPELKNHSIEVSTLHQSKGKQFDVVFIPHCNENKLPMRFSKQKFPTPYDLSKEDHREEEKRLFFVGISRAKQHLYLTSVEQYLENKTPAKISRFIQPLEIPQTNYNRETTKESLTNYNNVEEQLIKQTIDYLSNRDFSQAKEKIEVLEEIFSQNSSLKTFMDNNDEIKTLKNKLKQQNEVVPYDLSKHTFSVSQLKTYEQCPKKYLFQYIYKIPTPAKHYFDFGNSLHNVLEHIKPEIDAGLDQKKATLKALTLLSSYWESTSYKDAQEEQEYFDLGIECIKKFLDKEYKINTEERENIALEKKFFLTIDNKTIMGFMDRVDSDKEGLIIYDYKTSSSKQPQKELAEDLQLYTYALASKEDPQLKAYPTRMALWYLKHDSIDSIVFDENKAQEIKDKLTHLLKSIEQKDFTANPTTFGCSFCDFNSICEDAKTQK